MPIKSLSIQSVEDISDESAAVCSGGFGFQWFTTSTGSGASFNYKLDEGLNPAPVNGLVQSFQFSGPPNNDIEAIKVTNVPSNKAYTINFYDNNNFTGAYTSRRVTSSSNGSFKVLSEFLNRTSSIRIVRSA